MDWTMEAALDFGAWAAAMVTRKLGGRKGIPSRREIEETKFDQIGKSQP